MKKLLDVPTRPANLKQFDLGMFPKSEVNAKIALGEITCATPHLSDKRQVACLYGNSRADRRADRFNRYPMIAIAALVAEERRGLIGVVEKDVDIAVIVVVAEGGGAPDFRGQLRQTNGG